MKYVLIGCEVSGVVRRAFASFAGLSVTSCDLKPAADGSPDHLQMDLLQVINNHWDAAIFFPECTYLCVSGMHWTTRGLRDPQLTEDALAFVKTLMDATHIPMMALENPTGIISTRIRKADQRIQPYEYGDDASKGTNLWLRNLPCLVPDPKDYVPPRMVCQCGIVYPYNQADKGCPECGPGFSKPRWSNQTDSGQNKLGPSDTRAADRAKTYPGIALAMAEQWAPIILNSPSL